MLKAFGCRKSGQTRLGHRNCGQARLQRLERPPTSLCEVLRTGSDCGQALKFPPWRIRPGRKARAHASGQATVEYAIITGILIALVAIMALFMTTFNHYGERMLTIIASDYP